MNKHKSGRYTENDNMSRLIGDNPTTLLVLSRLGVPLGFGEKTIGQVCQETRTDTNTFLAIVNLLLFDIRDSSSNISLVTVMRFLHNSHVHFLEYRLPHIRKQLIDILDPEQKELNRAVMGYYDEYISEITKHMNYEEEVVFPYVSSLIKGEHKAKQSVQSKQHNLVETKLTEFKNILIKYYPAKSSEALNTVLLEIFSCEKDLAAHNTIEDELFMPRVIALTEKKEDTEQLSLREKEIIVCVAKGMTNKEIAQVLFISTHTVISHRRNISQKLEIHSTAGLIIYAIVNKLVEIEDIKPM